MFARDWRCKPIVMYTLMHATLTGAIPYLLPQFTTSNEEVTTLFVVSGFTTMVTAFAYGRAADTLGRRAVMLIGGGGVLLFCALLPLNTLESLPPSRCWAGRAAAFGFGVGNAVCFCNISACIVGVAHDCSRVAFATRQAAYSIGAVASFLVLPTLSAGIADASATVVLLLCLLYLFACPRFFRTETLPV
eukprot:NODE_3339_length_799_cov_316.903226.p1 GENE.NODE_3339_length_799_cov_316.903226~~NODE_3339_length_799_cov_316.903226.p1  ORF type:complete len:190 (-),score=40.62 NODE_3339_length_799_cov_316.903226:190-759(-)